MTSYEPQADRFVDFDPKKMPFRRFGSTGLRVPLFSMGSWLTIGSKVGKDSAKNIIRVAFENGINMFDTAEGYGAGGAELELGRIIMELKFRRSDIIVTTKIFFGTRKGPNDTGLSRKHIIEGTKESLQRLKLDYVDIIFAHRPDPTVPIEETVRAFNFVIEKGWAFYWATSEWSAVQIEEAHHVATRLNLIPPAVDQCQHHMFHRERPEKEYAPLYKNYAYGTTVWSVLGGGLLTGKYNNGIPEGSRYAVHKEDWGMWAEHLQSAEGQREVAKVKDLTKIAEQDLQCTMAQLALAWVAKINPYTCSVILGATKPEQVIQNLRAIDVLPKMTPEIMEKIEKVLDNKPAPITVVARKPYDSNFHALA